MRRLNNWDDSICNRRQLDSVRYEAANLHYGLGNNAEKLQQCLPASSFL